VSIIIGTLKIINKFWAKKEDQPNIFSEALGTVSALFLMISFSYIQFNLCKTSGDQW
jgi:hypothetical protein